MYVGRESLGLGFGTSVFGMFRTWVVVSVVLWGCRANKSLRAGATFMLVYIHLEP